MVRSGPQKFIILNNPNPIAVNSPNSVYKQYQIDIITPRGSEADGAVSNTTRLLIERYKEVQSLHFDGLPGPGILERTLAFPCLGLDKHFAIDFLPR